AALPERGDITCDVDGAEHGMGSGVKVRQAVTWGQYTPISRNTVMYREQGSCDEHPGNINMTSCISISYTYPSASSAGTLRPLRETAETHFTRKSRRKLPLAQDTEIHLRLSVSSAGILGPSWCRNCLSILRASAAE